ncbi:hypothetical protein [Bacillus horti]|uniref:DUF3899 domain-containing protein n=1 Tax=Caldalkalibacillus horti TaxID=77523 RepID=A0ABT9W3I7_9BACI|nr:hypothetical protein [Bacillus horti]MDQ0167816.1 hypothetical protein [Bacillus horti]
MIKTVYVYLVLFATLMMTIGGSVGVFMAIADYVSPQPYYQSYEDYRQMKLNNKFVGEEGNGTTEQTEIDEEQIRAEYERVVANERDKEKQRGLNRLIKSFGWIIIPLPVFVYYQRRL